MAGSSEPAFLFLSIKMELLLHRLSIYFATAPKFLDIQSLVGALFSMVC